MFKNYNLYNDIFLFYPNLKTYCTVALIIYLIIYFISLFIVVCILCMFNFNSNNFFILIKKLYFNIQNYKFIQLNIANLLGIPPFAGFILKFILGIFILVYTNNFLFLSYIFLNFFSFFFYLQILKFLKKNKINYYYFINYNFNNKKKNYLFFNFKIISFFIIVFFVFLLQIFFFFLIF